MRYEFTAEQEELRRMTRSFLATASSPERVRNAMESERGWDSELWQRLSEELGLPALTIPEEHGGAGFGHVELVAVMEELGRSLTCAPYFSSVCLGATALLQAGTAEQQAEHLPGIATGETLATLAVTEPSARWDARGINTTARADGNEYVLEGTKRYVLDGHAADLFVVAARLPKTEGATGVTLFLVPGDSERLVREPLTTLDQTRRQASICLDGVRVPASAILGEPGAGWEPLQKTLQLAAVALAAEQVGGAEACLDMAVEYAKTRKQFGKVIGAFQAIKHKCADMMTQVESARSAAYYAAWAASVDDPELPVLASLTKATCSDAYFHCAAENIQIHGGIGFTWEHDAHLYFKRAKSSESLLGDPSFHRELVAGHIGLP